VTVSTRDVGVTSAKAIPCAVVVEGSAIETNDVELPAEMVFVAIAATSSADRRVIATPLFHTLA
jgi:hypothetical protein